MAAQARKSGASPPGRASHAALPFAPAPPSARAFPLPAARAASGGALKATTLAAPPWPGIGGAARLAPGAGRTASPAGLALAAMVLAAQAGAQGRTWEGPWCLSPGKRAMDLVVATLLLLLAAPILLAAAISIKIDSPGPVFFRQWRTGFGGHRFRLFKFRTMVTEAERLKESLLDLNHHGPDSPDFKIRHDPRVTRVGRVLRRLSLDEIPNLLNVLLGDMSLIGPRPTSFGVERYAPWHFERLRVPPGVTGLWQISGRSEIDFDDRVRIDCEYIRRQSFWLDLKILVLTPVRALEGRGAC